MDRCLISTWTLINWTRARTCYHSPISSMTIFLTLYPVCLFLLSEFWGKTLMICNQHTRAHTTTQNLLTYSTYLSIINHRCYASRWSYCCYDIVYFRINLKTDDPRWVGAWWVSFFITVTTCWLIAIPLSCFGSELPSKW